MHFKAGDEKAGGFLQERTDDGWGDVGKFVKADSQGVALFELRAAGAGNRLRIKITGEVGAKLLLVRVLTSAP
ncbi:MAG: hypothetical protein FJW79_00270 [Actinobacteria bacterium]|nr:hypothetical protein [Actinomycetota bacterium]